MTRRPHRRVAEDLAMSIPDASLRIIVGAAHLANVERPEAFTTAILGHLQEVKT